MLLENGDANGNQIKFCQDSGEKCAFAAVFPAQIINILSQNENQICAKKFILFLIKFITFTLKLDQV